MKQIFVLLIVFYQKIISTILKNLLGISKFCRFEISCSEYSKQAINRHGIIRGSYLSIIRILNCQPYFRL